MKRLEAASSVAVNRSTKEKFAAFCRSRGLVIAFAAEQALAAWMKEQERTETGAKTK